MTAGAGDSDSPAGAADSVPAAAATDVGMGEAQYASDNDSITPDTAEPEPPAAAAAGQGEDEDEDYEDADADKQAANADVMPFDYTEDQHDAKRHDSSADAVRSVVTERSSHASDEMDSTVDLAVVAHAGSSDSAANESGRGPSDATLQASTPEIVPTSAGSIDDMEISIDSLRSLAVEVCHYNQ